MKIKCRTATGHTNDAIGDDICGVCNRIVNQKKEAQNGFVKLCQDSITSET